MAAIDHPIATEFRDEREIMRLLRACMCSGVEENERRAVRGALQYGPLDIDGDGRDFVREAGEELIDARFYLAAEVIRLRRLISTHAQQFASAPDATGRIDAHVNALISAIITIDATLRDLT